MTVASGEAVYSAGDPPSTGLGLMWSGEELDAGLNGPVAAVLFDDDGRADIEEILRGIVDTAFEQDGLRRVLAEPERIEDWRVGEAIAETWLTDHRDCRFPWPDGRDERKRGSSLPGADLGGCPRTRKIIVFENLTLYKSVVYEQDFLKIVYSRTAS